MKKPLYLALALFAYSALPGQAADPLPADKKKAIQEMIAVSNMKAALPQMIEQMSNQAQAAIRMQALQHIERDAKLNAEQKAAARQRVETELPLLMADMRNALNKANLPALMDEATFEIYGKHFETAEIRDITAFYRTPTGQKSLRLMPQISGESMRMVMGKVMPLVREQMRESAQRLQQKLDKPQS